MLITLRMLTIILTSVALMSINIDREIGDAKNTSPDTIVVERVDASDFILTFSYYYDEGDTAATNNMQKQETAFLKSQGLPTEGIGEITMSARLNIDSIITNYEKSLNILKNSPHVNLYRRVCSEMIIKYLCQSNNVDEANLKPPHNRMIFFLNEMKDSKGVNIELMYTAFLKFQYKNDYKDICQTLAMHLPYFKEVLAGSEEFYTKLQSGLGGGDPAPAFVLADMNNRITARKEYLADLEFMQDVVCK